MFNINLIKIFILSILFLINILLLSNLFYLKNTNEFEVNFLDVGQGNATLFKYKSELNILIDSGKDVYGRKSLYKNLSFFDRNLDLTFATHYDFDHVGNFLDYFNKYNISYFFRNGKESKAPIYEELLKLIKKEDIKNIDLKAGDIIKIDKNSFIEILFPEEKINVNKLKDNDSSLILKLTYKNKTFLITGDASKKIESWMVEKYGKKLKSDFLLAGHHGSKTSSSEEFLRAVSPEYIIFSVGKNNSYHHPHPTVISLVDKLGIKYFRTDINGTIKYIFNGEDWILKLEK